MKPPPFAYERPPDVESAVELLASHGRDGKVLAGGQSLVPLLNLRLVRPAVLVDVNALRGLDRIEVDGGVLRLGSLVRQAQLQMPVVRTHSPLLADAIAHAGHPQIRNRGTVGGSVAHADPAAELPTCLVALDASVHVRSVRGGRTIGWQELFVGPLTTTIAHDELLTEIELRLPPPGSGQAFLEFARRHGDFALGGAAAVITLDDHGVCTRAAVAMLAAGATPVRAHEAERVLAGGRLDDELAREAAEAAVRELSPLSDVHGTAEYRRGVNRAMVRRALLLAAARARASLN